MTIRSRLLTSVAVPFLSLPLMLQPASAMPFAAPAAQQAKTGVILVQQPLPLPEGGQPEGEGKPAEAQEQPKKEEAPEQQPAEPQQRPAEAEPVRPPEPKAEAPKVEEPKPEAPKAEAPAAAPEQKAEPEQKPERVKKAEPEQKAEPEPQPEKQPKPERPRKEPAAAPVTEPAPEAAPAQAPAEKPAPAREAPAPKEPPAPKPKAQEAPAAEPAPKAEAQQPAPAAEPPAAKPERAGQPEKPQRGTSPDAATAPGKRGDAAEPGRRPDRQPDRQGGAPRPDGERPPQPSEKPPAVTTPAEAPVSPPAPAAPGDAAAPAPVPVPAAPEQQAQPKPPTTPEDIKRAEEIAKDPASAPAGQTIVLPVENGAAVLDSAKEDSPRDRGGRDPNRPAGQRPDRGRDPAAGARPGTPPPAQAQGEIRVPRSDADAQVRPGNGAPPVKIEAVTEERGERIDRRPEFERQRGWDDQDRNGRPRERRDDGRVIFEIDNRTVIRHDDSRRFYGDDDAEPEYERLRGGRTREIVERRDGTQVVTIRNRYGEIIQRSRIARDGREYVLYYAPEVGEERPDRAWRDPGLDLPPMRLAVPLDDYIIDTSSDQDRDYYRFLEQPPVERVERVYSLDEVRYSARIRDKVRRIDLDTITFDTGSAEISMSQAKSLRQVADAINKVLKNNPAETFLIEGHTDAVGSDDSNLVLSDRRAESVAMILSDTFDIPPENMATQGYGERYLKVRTDGPSQENRRVTIRRITPLVRPVATK